MGGRFSEKRLPEKQRHAAQHERVREIGAELLIDHIVEVPPIR